MTYTFEQTKKGYAALWDKAEVKPQFNAEAMKQAKRLIDAEDRLKKVEALTQVPWYMVGVMLYRESNLNFNTYLGNGQSLSHVTTIVPRGRGPFQTFEQGAVDAIKLEGIQGLTWTLELMLYWLERFNGQGYFGHKVNDPYLWSWTTLYTVGKFTSDGHFNPDFTDPQGGCAAILKALFEIDPTLMPPRIAKEGTVPTTPTQPTAPAQGFDLSQIIHLLETAVNFVPIASKFFPPLAVVAPFVPLIEGGLKMLEELEAAPHDPTAIAGIIQKHLQNVVTDLEAIKGPSQNTTGG